ncbi:hypothetical protein ABZ826_30045 [Streptomyces sp. NPDC047515]|uniref:hypothetical protein n=1 Tax=Streptomyces sp. NPDC047515 TaxID=3155380 RepID=UPI0033DC88CF
MSRDPPLSRRGGGTGDLGGAAFCGGGTTTATGCEASGAGPDGFTAGARVGVAAGLSVGIRDGVTDGCAVVAAGLSLAGTDAPGPAAPSTTAAITSPDTGLDARLPAIFAPRMIM